MEKEFTKVIFVRLHKTLPLLTKLFFQFHEKNKDFLYADDKNKNLTFHSSLVHHAFAKIKHLEPGKIVELIGSNMFIFYTVLIILAIILALMICFCPGVVFCILSAMFSQIVKFATLFFSLFYRGLQFLYTSIVAAYQSRQNENIPDNDIQMPAPPSVRTAASKPFLTGSVLIHNDLTAQPDTEQFRDQSGSGLGATFECPPNLNVRPIAKMLKFQSVPINDFEATAATAPTFQSAHPRTPSFTRIFRRN